MSSTKDIVSILVQPEDTAVVGDFKSLAENYDLPLEDARKVIEALNSPRPDILSDFPTDKDSLNFNTLVRTISNIIFAKSTQTPLTISINGEWGSGKTSTLKMIQAHARTVGYPCIWINAWNLTDIISAIDREVIREFNLQEDVDESNELSSIYWSLSKLDFGKFVERLLIKKDMEEARLIIFVDDLDRAFPDQILEILRSLKLVLESPNCVFILAMDMDVVAHSLARAYIKQNLGDSNLTIAINAGGSIDISNIEQRALSQAEENDVVRNFGYKYLEKIVQIQVKIPPLTRKVVSEYLKQLNVADEIIEIVAIAPEQEVVNPRRLKKYLNWLSISLQLIVALPIPSTITNLNALRVIALRSDYPDVYENLIKSSMEDFSYPLHLESFLIKIPLSEIKSFDFFLRETPLLDLKRG